MDEMVFIMMEHFKEYGHAYRKLLEDRKKRVILKIKKNYRKKMLCFLWIINIYIHIAINDVNTVYLFH